MQALSRIIPILLTSVLDQSRVGAHIIKLQEVCELITAPSLTVDEIDDVLDLTVHEYLDLRVAAVHDLVMSNLKPKHHVLGHYARLHKENGPLIQCWAMRRKSKHVFFENVIRTAKNFKNPPMTCDVQHQLAQISYHFQGLFPLKLEIPGNSLPKKEYLDA